MRVPILLTLTLLAACGNPETVSGEPAHPTNTTAEAKAAGVQSQTYPIADFSAVESSGPDRVQVAVGPGFSVRAEGPAGSLDTLIVARDGDALTIGRERSFDGRVEPATIVVTMPHIERSASRGSGALSVDRVDGSAFEGTVAGSGDLRIRRMSVGVLTLNVGGSGTMMLAGTAQRLEATTAGSGDIEAKGLVATEAAVTVQGSGSVAATVNGPATVSVVGSGDVNLGDGARCTISVAGSGEVNCGQTAATQ